MKCPNCDKRLDSIVLQDAPHLEQGVAASAQCRCGWAGEVDAAEAKAEVKAKVERAKENARKAAAADKKTSPQHPSATVNVPKSGGKVAGGA